MVGDVAVSEGELERAVGGGSPPGTPTPDRVTALQDLIFQLWVGQEAARRGIEVSSARIDRAAGAQVGRFGRKRLLYDLLYNEIVKRSGAVREAAIHRAFIRNRASYAVPEQRYMNILAFETKAMADAAERQLLDGRPWRSVWERSFHDVQGGSAPEFGLLPGEGAVPLDRAVFRARVGVMVGPIKANGAWYLFKLSRIIPASRGSYAAERDGIRQQLLDVLERRLRTSFRREYRPLTFCRKELVVPACRAG